ncbi:MAG: hypothetical protein EPN97_14330 [Alphaproteobacteria bacterium]|nr:MAG: hypothetical protein EPN97_14330 [Alphaproteobacteria bacterium]
MPASALKHSLTLALFSLTLFISAAAMFVLQLMVGKMLLPLTGGTPAGWIVAMAFFQLALLAGYALAFWLSRYPPRVHGFVFLAALAAGAACLPVAFPHDAQGEINALFVFRLLAVTVGIPAIAISATSSTIQRLFASTRHAAAGDPYFLYAASNAGSMAGLLLYPFAIETLLTLTWQSRLWFCAYALLVALAAGCMFVAGRTKEPAPRAAAKPPTWKKRAEWAMLAFFPSSLLLGVTMHITTVIISAPLLWVVPMTLYLLTFVLAFSRIPAVSSDGDSRHGAAAALIALVLVIPLVTMLRIPWEASWHLIALTLIGLMFHARLASQRPETQHLADFYLMIAAGGAMGGILNAFIAPMIFSQNTEYPLVAVLACLAHPALRPSVERKNAVLYAAAVCLGAACVWMLLNDIIGPREAIFVGILTLMAFFPRVLAVAGIISICVYTVFRPLISISLPNLQQVVAARSFFGIVRVYEENIHIENAAYTVRVMEHGTTTHGFQVLAPAFETTPTSYYGPPGEILKAFNARKVAVIGLGTGTVACHGAPDRQFTFFELNPEVIGMARLEFSYLKKCPAAGAPRVIQGDGRLEMAKMTSDKFDVIILDAFSSDTIPAHLLTREAIEMYLDRLEEGGFIVFNITNRYLRLERLLAAAAADMSLHFLWKQDVPAGNPFYMASTWALMSRNETGMATLQRTGGWKSMEPQGIRPWTDNYSSILDILNR